MAVTPVTLYAFNVSILPEVKAELPFISLLLMLSDTVFVLFPVEMVSRHPVKLTTLDIWSHMTNNLMVFSFLLWMVFNFYIVV